MTMKILELLTNCESVMKEAERLWRLGEYAQARFILEGFLLKQDNASSNDIVRASTLLGIVESDAGELKASRAVLRNAAPLLPSCAPLIRGKYHNTLAITLRRLGDLDQALQEYTAASIYHEQAREFKMRAQVENNIGWLLITMGHPADAYEHLERASQSWGDPVMRAQVEDTIARAKLAEGKTDEALDYSLSSVNYLRSVGERNLLDVSLKTLKLICERVEYDRECERIKEALSRSRGNTEKAARMLGIKRQTLDDKLNTKRYSHLKEKRQPLRKPRGKYATSTK